IEMMRDPHQSTFAFVVYPEATPILEAYRASEELKTLGIKPGLVFANLVLPAEQCTTGFMKARRTMQDTYLTEIAVRFAAPVIEMPLLPHEVSGRDMLIELGHMIYGVNAPALARETA
ncbi:MAG TPA: ArsA-related P-loop ATPase, partial [Candidatus Limnocylindrales bacterium]|nr:ArsA-related P-loop ATPase [Candidatus Limnocylindrales bacterium]